MIKWMLGLLLVCSMSGVSAGGALAGSLDHHLWDQLLERHVTPVRGGQATTVNYRGFAQDKAQLRQYLKQLAAVGKVEFNQWPKAEQLAFLINAYNAWTVSLILSEYPGIDSIKDLGSLLRSPWKKAFIPLFGKTRSLDDIEHGLIRGSGRYNDPRIHFAVNCASVGCPALRAEAYIATRLEGQLEAQTALFLADRSRNYLDGPVLRVSSIFKWYREDFETGWRGISSLADFFIRYKDDLSLSDTDVRGISNGDIRMLYLNYDWRLNDSHR